MQKILTEISNLSERDCFNIIERHKSKFTYPIHRHTEFELNYVQNAAGVQRVIGDNIETIGDFDLVLIGNENLEHVWQQGTCNSKDIREITIQFSPKLFSPAILSKNQFISIKKMFENARHGIVFPTEAIMKVYNILDSLATEKDGFIQFTNFLLLLYYLSKFESRPLSSNTFTNVSSGKESRRITLVQNYIDEHYLETIKLDDLASMAGMTPTAFSRFFKLRTHRTISEYITEIKLGVASRALVDTSQNISEICYASGFNNISNFNRIFKAKKGMTPKEFRAVYKKNKVIV
ncbi:MAG: AraC family transcriptional regulator [Bacteroidales bacterium]|nr:AraC family transcriptional regulator [Bacteroidales bacterium]